MVNRPGGESQAGGISQDEQREIARENAGGLRADRVISGEMSSGVGDPDAELLSGQKPISSPLGAQSSNEVAPHEKPATRLAIPAEACTWLGECPATLVGQKAIVELKPTGDRLVLLFGGLLRAGAHSQIEAWWLDANDQEKAHIGPQQPFQASVVFPLTDGQLPAPSESIRVRYRWTPPGQPVEQCEFQLPFVTDAQGYSE
jgi:hypothetical protein